LNSVISTIERDDKSSQPSVKLETDSTTTAITTPSNNAQETSEAESGNKRKRGEEPSSSSSTSENVAEKKRQKLNDGSAAANTSSIEIESDESKLEIKHTDDLPKSESLTQDKTVSTQSYNNTEEQKVITDNTKKETFQATHIDIELEHAYQYFDKNRAGFLIDKDMEHLFHCLNTGFSKRYVRDLVAAVCDVHKREHGKVLMYRQLVEGEKEVS